jgi:hypothetical protein
MMATTYDTTDDAPIESTLEYSTDRADAHMLDLEAVAEGDRVGIDASGYDLGLPEADFTHAEHSRIAGTVYRRHGAGGAASDLWVRTDSGAELHVYPRRGKVERVDEGERVEHEYGDVHGVATLRNAGLTFEGRVAALEPAAVSDLDPIAASGSYRDAIDARLTELDRTDGRIGGARAVRDRQATQYRVESIAEAEALEAAAERTLRRADLGVAQREAVERVRREAEWRAARLRAGVEAFARDELTDDPMNRRPSDYDGDEHAAGGPDRGEGVETDGGVTIHETHANGIDVRYYPQYDDSTTPRRLAAALPRADPSVERVSAKDDGRAVVWLVDDPDGRECFEAPDGWEVENVLVSSGGRSGVRVRRVE